MLNLNGLIIDAIKSAGPKVLDGWGEEEKVADKLDEITIEDFLSAMVEESSIEDIAASLGELAAKVGKSVTVEDM